MFLGDGKQLAMNCAALECLWKLLLLCGQLSAEILRIAWDFSIFVQFLPYSCNNHWGFFLFSGGDLRVSTLSFASSVKSTLRID